MTNGATATQARAQGTQQTEQLRFPVGARSRDTQTFYDETRTMGASSTFLPEAKVPVGDWLRGVWILVEVTTDSTTATPVLAADAPWSVFSEVSFLDAAGNTVQSLAGYSFFLQYLLGGFTFQTDPTASPFYTAFPEATGTNTGRFILRLPIEVIDRELLGAYPNASSNAAVRVKLTLAPEADLYSTAPDNSTSVNVKMISNGAVLPSAASATGRPFSPEPMGAGTFQQWTEIPYDLQAGRKVFPHERKGNVYRELIFVTRDSAGDRSDAIVSNFEFSIDDVPNPPAGPWDYCRHLTWTRQNFAAASLPAGVIVVDFCSEWDGKVGGELRDDWIITAPGSKVEFKLDVDAAGELLVITNEIIPRGPGVLRV